MSLKEYKKRRISSSPEPKASLQLKKNKREQELIFVIQKHAATHLHYDLRLELNGVLKSWAIPKMPSLDPKVKRLAMAVEDHPIEYATFEETIPKGHYGAGEVEIWDSGTYSPFVGTTLKEKETTVAEQLEKGELKFVLYGKRLKGTFVLVHMNREGKNNEWLLIKKKDDYSDEEADKENREEVDLSVLPITSMPHRIKPMLAYLVEEPFSKENWIYEIKWDGYRAIAEISPKMKTLYSRNFQSFENSFPPVLKAFHKVKNEMILDGEIVLLDKKGRPRFQLLQNYLKSKETEGQLKYYVFDVLFYRGHDLRNLPLIQRKSILKNIIQEIDSPIIQYSDFVKEKGVQFFKEAEKVGLEGIMAKDATSLYLSKRSKNWLKIKTHLKQEVVIAGFTAPRKPRKFFGSLILGVYEDNDLKYVGHSGGGFNQKSLHDIYHMLLPLERDKCPFSLQPKTNEKATWVEPKIVCEVSFQEWTQEGIMRQPIFEGLRIDKPAKNVSVEKIATPPKGEKTPKIQGSIDLTNTEKVFWPKEGYTKGDLIKYYKSVSDFILPHLKDRPLMLHRFPDGILGNSFFQKEAPSFIPTWIKTFKFQHSEKTVNYIIANDVNTLLYIINLGTIDIHPFLSRINDINKPDFLVLDLDPTDISFDHVIEVAREIHKFLDELKIYNFCKTSGKRGLHIYLPLQAKYPYEIVAQFSRLLAKLIHERIPDITSIERLPKNRQKKVYIDFLQNEPTKSVVAPYSARALDHAPVATPLDWKEVKKGLDPYMFNIQSLPSRLQKKGDLFAKVLEQGLPLPSILKKMKRQCENFA